MSARQSKRESRSFSPLTEVLSERTTPELAYLESKFAAPVSYGVTVDLLADVLPLGGAINVASLHRRSSGWVLASIATWATRRGSSSMGVSGTGTRSRHRGRR